MFDCSTYLLELEKMSVPKDLAKTSVMLEEPVSLRSLVEADQDKLETADLLYRNARGTRKHPKNPWDVDIKASGPGYFDDVGNYILSKPKKIYVTWILKKDDTQEGPFSDREFKTLIGNIVHSEYEVKRDFDKGFVPLDRLLEEVPLLGFKDLNKFFARNQVFEESKKEEDFFDTSIVNEKSSRLTNFLKNHDISASVDFIVKSIRNMKKTDAIETLKDITGLDRCVNAALIDLIVESVNYQILSDVDKDGFSIGDERKLNRRR